MLNEQTSDAEVPQDLGKSVEIGWHLSTPIPQKWMVWAAAQGPLQGTDRVG